MVSPRSASVRSAPTPWPDRGDGPVSGYTSVTERPSRTVDPLYPEPTGDRRWIAERPLPWLGIGSSRRATPDLACLVADGTVPDVAADLLLALLRNRSSILVIAGPSGAGKTTLLEALLPLYPREDRRIRLRGSFETFAWATDARFDPAHAVLIAEEISGHLPTYLWGPPVGRFLAWRERGAALLATAHGESIEDVARLLAGYPLRLPLRSVAAFEVIVRLGPAPDVPSCRPVLTDIWSIGLTPDGGLTQASLFDRRVGIHVADSDGCPNQPGLPHHATSASLPAGSTRIGSS